MKPSKRKCEAISNHNLAYLYWISIIIRILTIFSWWQFATDTAFRTDSSVFYVTFLITDRRKWLIGFGFCLKPLFVTYLSTYPAANRYCWCALLSSFTSLNKCWQMRELTVCPTVETGRYGYMWFCWLLKTWITAIVCKGHLWAQLSFWRKNWGFFFFFKSYIFGLLLSDGWGMHGLGKSGFHKVAQKKWQ